MKYISHIKDLVSGIIDNDLVTKDTEGYKALVALKNHLDSLKEIHKYMPYQDPGPVIQNLEQGLANRNTEIRNLKTQLEDTEVQLQQKTMSRDSCYKYWQEYKSKYETLEQKNQELKKKFQDLNDENAHNIALIDQNHQAIENYQNLKEELEKLKSDKEDLIKEAESLDKLIRSQDTKIEELKEELNEKNSYIEDLKKQTSEAQCDLDNWVNYKGPDFEDQIHRLEEKNKALLSLLTQEQKDTYHDQIQKLEDPYYKTLLDKKQDEISFLLDIISEDQLEEFQEYLRTQLPDDQPQHRSPKPNRSKKRRITNR